MRHGSLFSGIGGFDLAAEWMGWENVFHCEISPFCKKILKYYWPNAASHSDIHTTDFTIYRGRIDILTGGFPCQPFSNAGKRKGIEDDRHLWPEMLRVIREVQPTWIVGENVLGIVSWDGGLVFEQVQSDLEAEGYEVQPYVLPACAVNAPHRRDRVWFVAYASGRHDKGNEREFSKEDGGSQLNNISTPGESSTGLYIKGDATDADQQGLSERLSGGIGRLYGQAGASERGQPTRTNPAGDWREFPTQSPLCIGNDGLSSRLDGITFSKWRIESIKAAGNAIIWKASLQIFKAIEAYNNTL